MVHSSDLDASAETPLYRQLFAKLKAEIEEGTLRDGERLPPTRELAGSLGLNRTTVSAAYDLLEAEGLLKGHVGRGSFVNAPQRLAGVAWGDLLEARSSVRVTAPALISFSNSRPSELLFPMEEFRCTCTEVIHGKDAHAILQLGSPSGYAPLRSYLLERARSEGAARPSDDILITSGCQQAFDLLQRTLASNGETVLLEDPVYAGVRNAFQRGGARVIGVPAGPEGMEIEPLEKAIARERPRLVAITSNFQNPTGATLPAVRRKAVLRACARAGVVVIENDIYGDLRYEGERLPTVKQLDPSGDTVLLRSFSKLAFPGLRVGWIIGPRALVSKLTEAKQWSDLHTDQLSQAVFLRFAESGRLEQHRLRMITAGRERLRAVLDACRRHLPAGASFTRPEGGMNVWVRLPEPLDTSQLLDRAEREGVTYLPGSFFAVEKGDSRSLRLSFAGLAPDRIEAGIAILGRIFAGELERVREFSRLESAPALV